MTWSSILGQIVAGWLLADFVGGVVHWWEDRYARVSWPVLGRLVAEPNRLHHDDPLAFTRNSVISRNSTMWPLVLAIAAIWLVLVGFSPLWLAATIGGLVTTEVHYFAHRPGSAPAWINALQRTGLIQSSREHGGHHRDTDSRFCILTNLLNPLLDASGFWFAIERGLLAIGVRVNEEAR